MDAMSAAFHGGARLVLTDLDTGCVNVDYYRDAVAGRLVDVPRHRLDTVALDLGVFCGRDVRAEDPRPGRESGRRVPGATPDTAPPATRAM